MSGADSAPVPQPASGTLPPQNSSPLTHLLHALNQPLTGLQCSLELAVAGPRRTEQYIRTLREGLELSARMRLLVEAIRELTDTSPTDADKSEIFLLNTLLQVFKRRYATNLIVAQRGFEADAKAVTTFDQITQDTIALKQ
jgi:hypothetical protein